MNAELGEDLRQLGNMPEGVRHITDLHRLAVTAGDFFTKQQVAGDALANGEAFVRLDIPGADQQAALLDKAGDFLLALRVDLKVILQNAGLAVQHEAVVGLAGENIQNAVDYAVNIDARLFIGYIPFPVQMAGTDDKQFFLFHVHSSNA